MNDLKLWALVERCISIIGLKSLLCNLEGSYYKWYIKVCPTVHSGVPGFVPASKLQLYEHRGLWSPLHSRGCQKQIHKRQSLKNILPVGYDTMPELTVFDVNGNGFTFPWILRSVVRASNPKNIIMYASVHHCSKDMLYTLLYFVTTA